MKTTLAVTLIIAVGIFAATRLPAFHSDSTTAPQIVLEKQNHLPRKPEPKPKIDTRTIVEVAKGVEANEQLIALLRDRDTKEWLAESELPKEVELHRWMCWITGVTADDDRTIVQVKIIPVGLYAHMSAMFTETLEEQYHLQYGRLALLARKKLPLGYMSE